MRAAPTDPMAVFADAGWRADLALVAEGTAREARQLAADAQLLDSLGRPRPDAGRRRGGCAPLAGVGTTWFTPAGQIVQVPDHDTPAPEWDDAAPLPNPAELHALEAELVRPHTDQDDPPVLPPS